MEKVESSSASLWLPYAVVVAVMAVGLVAGPRVTPTRPGIAEAGAAEPSQEGQSIPARLWQDPLEATETVRRTLRTGDLQSATAQGAYPFEKLVRNHTTIDGIPSGDGTVDYFDDKGSHRVLFQFVSLPSEAYPEAGEQRIRARVAIVSALTTAGYRPANAARLGVAFWDANHPAPAVTSQIGYPFEIFEFDSERKVLLPKEKLSRKFDEVIVLYVEEAALQSARQFEWLRRLSCLLAAESPPERFTERRWVVANWLGPLSSDRMVALLRAAGAEQARAVKQAGGRDPDLQPAPTEALPITVLAVRPTIEPSFVHSIVKSSVALDEARRSAALAEEGGWAQFVTALEKTPRRIPLALRREQSGNWRPWLTLERVGCDDALLTTALARELTLRRPELFNRGGSKNSTGGGTVALVSEWDTLYGRALPLSFEAKFLAEGGHAGSVRHYTYLRGLDGHISGPPEKPRTEATKPAETVDLFRQVLKSRAPSISFGRTQVDYIDRLAAQLRVLQRAEPKQHLEAVGILGSDTYDKLLILQGLRKEFPSVLYFTTELDASLFAPENYDITHNLLVASGFDLRLREQYQGAILPFRDSWQTSIYFATLHATQYFLMQQNQETVGAPLEEWSPEVMEIGRSGPYVLNSATSVPAKGPPHSPLPETSLSARRAALGWLVPLVALAVVLITATTHYGRLAAVHALAVIARFGRLLLLLKRRRAKWTGLQRLWMRDFSTWLVILAATMFVVVAACIPQVAAQPNEEPFYIAEGISSWPATWLRALGVFVCACYFWIISWQFRQALARASREFVETAPAGCPPAARSCRSTPCEDLEHFRHRSSGGKIKLIIVISWIVYVGVAWLIFSLLDLPALVTRGTQSIRWEKGVLIAAVFSINLLIVYAVVHNISCSFFIQKVARWLGNPNAPDADEQPLHTALMRAIGHVAGAMTQMIYYPFMLLFLLMAARHPLFDNFDWPMALIVVFSISSGVLLVSTLLLRRSADQARRNAVAWLERRIARLKWQLVGDSEEADPEIPEHPSSDAKGQLADSADASNSESERLKLLRAQRERRKEKDEGRLRRAEWQLSQINQIGGAALSVGILSNPLLRAVLIPLGGTGLLQLMEVFGKIV